jgi:hypothetical protein
MRRAITLGVVMGLLLALVAGAAYAANTITGTPGDDLLIGDQSGEPEQDTIFGLAGDDTIYGLRESDTLYSQMAMTPFTEGRDTTC